MSSPSTPESPTSAGFNTDQIPHNTSDNDEAAVDPDLIADEPEEPQEEEEGEDLFNDNFMDDYRRMDEQNQYESLGLDDSMEDERDLDQIMRDRRAAEVELEARGVLFSSRKLPHLLHDNG